MLTQKPKPTPSLLQDFKYRSRIVNSIQTITTEGTAAEKATVLHHQLIKTVETIKSMHTKNKMKSSDPSEQTKLSPELLTG